MRKPFRSPLSLGLACGAMASLCWSAWDIMFGSMKIGTAFVALMFTGLVGPAFFLALPGCVLRQVQMKSLKLGAAIVLCPFLLILPNFVFSCSIEPAGRLAVFGVYAVLFPVGILLILALFEQSRSDRLNSFCALGVSMLGFLSIIASSVTAWFLVEDPFALQIVRSVAILCCGPWLGFAMWHRWLPSVKALTDAQGSNPPAGGGE